MPKHLVEDSIYRNVAFLTTQSGKVLFNLYCLPTMDIIKEILNFNLTGEKLPEKSQKKESTLMNQAEVLLLLFCMC